MRFSYVGALALSLSILLHFIGAPIAASAATPFVHETVDTQGGYTTSLALDTQGNPRIAHYLPGDLKYAAKNGGVWMLETVDAAGDVGEYCSLALDAFGNPRIAYRRNDTGDLRYAAKNGGAWTIEDVDTTSLTGLNSSLALDAQGNPRISYMENPSEDLKYASKNFGVWSRETVDAAGRVGAFSSLRLDASGNPHISYFDLLNGDLKYARKAGFTWVIEVVDATGVVGLYTSLRLDAQGNPKISYYDLINSDLKYASKNGSTWTIETVDATGNVGEYASLALDAEGNPHISYHDDTNGDLKYASKVGSTWTIETLDAASSTGRYGSLALDAQDNPRISYLDHALGDLRYTDAAVHVGAPLGGETWPVGSLREIKWSGVGPVDVLLSVDGGKTFGLLREGLVAKTWAFRVPHAPTRFASLRVHRSTPLSTAETDSFFTIDASIALLSFKAEPIGDGVLLSWNTQPGPQDLAGYRIERDRGGLWQLVNALVQGTSYTDPEGNPGDRYRLSGVNGLGEALLLGEVAVTPRVLLAAWPLPYRQGDLSISFAAGAGPGGAPALTEVLLFDLSGRLVRTLLRQDLPSGYYSATWDGRDDQGERVPSGLYFLHSRTAGSETTHKVTVLR